MSITNELLRSFKPNYVEVPNNPYADCCERASNWLLWPLRKAYGHVIYQVDDPRNTRIESTVSKIKAWAFWFLAVTIAPFTLLGMALRHFSTSHQIAYKKMIAPSDPKSDTTQSTSSQMSQQEEASKEESNSNQQFSTSSLEGSQLRTQQNVKNLASLIPPITPQPFSLPLQPISPPSSALTDLEIIANAKQSGAISPELLRVILTLERIDFNEWNPAILASEEVRTALFSPESQIKDLTFSDTLDRRSHAAFVFYLELAAKNSKVAVHCSGRLLSHLDSESAGKLYRVLTPSAKKTFVQEALTVLQNLQEKEKWDIDEIGSFFGLFDSMTREERLVLLPHLLQEKIIKFLPDNFIIQLNIEDIAYLRRSLVKDLFSTRDSSLISKHKAVYLQFIKLLWDSSKQARAPKKEALLHVIASALCPYPEIAVPLPEERTYYLFIELFATIATEIGVRIQDVNKHFADTLVRACRIASVSLTSPDKTDQLEAFLKQMSKYVVNFSSSEAPFVSIESEYCKVIQEAARKRAAFPDQLKKLYSMLDTNKKAMSVVLSDTQFEAFIKELQLSDTIDPVYDLIQSIDTTHPLEAIKRIEAIARIYPTAVQELQQPKIYNDFKYDSDGLRLFLIDAVLKSQQSDEVKAKKIRIVIHRYSVREGGNAYQKLVQGFACQLASIARLEDIKPLMDSFVSSNKCSAELAYGFLSKLLQENHAKKITAAFLLYWEKWLSYGTSLTHSFYPLLPNIKTITALERVIDAIPSAFGGDWEAHRHHASVITYFSQLLFASTPKQWIVYLILKGQISYTTLYTISSHIPQNQIKEMLGQRPNVITAQHLHMLRLENGPLFQWSKAESMPHIMRAVDNKSDIAELIHTYAIEQIFFSKEAQEARNKHLFELVVTPLLKCSDNLAGIIHSYWVNEESSNKVNEESSKKKDEQCSIT